MSSVGLSPPCEPPPPDRRRARRRAADGTTTDDACDHGARERHRAFSRRVCLRCGGRRESARRAKGERADPTRRSARERPDQGEPRAHARCSAALGATRRDNGARAARSSSRARRARKRSLARFAHGTRSVDRTGGGSHTKRAHDPTTRRCAHLELRDELADRAVLLHQQHDEARHEFGRLSSSRREMCVADRRSAADRRRRRGDRSGRRGGGRSAVSERGDRRSIAASSRNPRSASRWWCWGRKRILKKRSIAIDGTTPTVRAIDRAGRAPEEAPRWWRRRGGVSNPFRPRVVASRARPRDDIVVVVGSSSRCRLDPPPPRLHHRDGGRREVGTAVGAGHDARVAQEEHERGVLQHEDRERRVAHPRGVGRDDRWARRRLHRAARRWRGRRARTVEEGEQAAPPAKPTARSKPT